MVQEAFALYKPRRVAFALDVGVGTGLVGEMVRKHMEPSGQLVGVDLSAMMLKRAESKRIYTETHQAEALVWLRDS
ncbi:MAG: methyltransferase domain-containing protein, partial [Promethearchaeia archaeon]